LSVSFFGEDTFVLDGGNDLGVLALEVGEVKFFELGNLGGQDLVEVTSHTSVEDADLFFSGEGNILLLFEELSELLTSVELLLGGGIEIRTELGESGDFTILGEFELHGTGDLFHGLDLGSGTDTGHRETDVNGGANTFVEQLGFQEDLTISNGNHISGNIGRHITSLGLNDGEGSEGASTVVLVHLGSTLKKTRVQIEHITGVSFTTWGTSQKERHLTVSDGLLGQIVIDDETVHAVVTEVFTNSATGVRSQELEGSGIGGGSSNDDSVSEGLTFLEETHNVGNSGSLLTDSDVDAVELLNFIASIVITLLVKDGIDGNSGLTSLTITNDQFTLTTTNGHK